MITTFSGRIASIKEGRMIQGANGQMPVIDFYLALDRGNYKKRLSLVDGKEYDSDLYKVSIFGQQAISFHQYAQVGRKLSISGRLVQEEFVSSKQIVQIDRQNPAFPYLAQLVGKVQGIEGKPDGNIYMLANHAVTRTSIICQEHRWEDKNPNGNSGFSNFTPQDNSNFSNSGFGNTNTGFGMPSAGFAPPTNQGFGVQQPTGFSAPQTQPTGFGGFGSQQTSGFAPQQQGFGAPQGFAQASANNASQFGGVQFSQGSNPEVAPSFAGFGGESATPTGFGTPEVNAGGFAMPQVEGESFSNFTPSVATNANANTGFATPVVTKPDTNIPSADKKAEEGTAPENANQGF